MLTIYRTQRHHLYASGRNLPYAVPGDLSRHQRGCRQARIDFGANLLGVLQHRDGGGNPADDAARLGFDCVQCRDDLGGGGDALSDPVRPEGPRAASLLGRQDGDAGESGIGATGREQPVCGAADTIGAPVAGVVRVARVVKSIIYPG
jgi:hypothetical protein